MGRAPCCDKSNVKRGPWSPEEDAMLKSFIQENGTGGNWIALPQKIGLKRCGKSCRLRWLNYLRPDIKHGEFSEEEDNIICNLYLSIGSRWSIIAAQLPGRTDNDIKNYWNTRLKKKLLGKRKELHHQTRRINKSENNENANVVEDMKQSCYYPEPTFKMPCSYQELPHDHVSIRKLLISLGGRFLDNQQVNSTLNLQDPLGISTTNHLYSASSTSQLQVHHHTDNSIAGFSCSSSACAPSGSCNTLNHDSSGLHFDIGDLVYSNSQGLALFGYPYGEEIITNIHSNAANGNAWVDGTSLVPFELGYPSHVSDCESYQQEIMQECVLNSENHASGECI